MVIGPVQRSFAYDYWQEVLGELGRAALGSCGDRREESEWQRGWRHGIVLAHVYVHCRLGCFEFMDEHRSSFMQGIEMTAGTSRTAHIRRKQ